VKYVVFYESAEDVAAKAPPFFAAHVARYQEYVRDGSLLMIGTFADPQRDDACGNAVFGEGNAERDARALLEAAQRASMQVA